MTGIAGEDFKFENSLYSQYGSGSQISLKSFLCKIRIGYTLVGTSSLSPVE